MNKSISSVTRYIGVDDLDLDLFEGQYKIANGVSYNSYVILDEKVAVMDTVDVRKTDEWLQQLDEALNGSRPDYIVVQHMEPDHAASLGAFISKYPEAKIVATAIAIRMLPLYFEGIDFASRCIAVKENDTLDLGTHTLRFVAAPMVHWPEVMVTYDECDKVLFSADAFGKFGALSVKEDWTDEARRYYFNIVGKYGAQVQTLLKKAAGLDIRTICPLHGPILTENLGYYLGLYDTWSSYKPESQGIFIAYASIYGNTGNAAKALAEELRSKGCTDVTIADLARDDQAKALENAFRCATLVVASSTYDASVFPPMKDFISHLAAKNFSNRRVAIIENGSWAPVAGKVMAETFSQMKGIELIAPTVTIRGAFKQTDRPAITSLATTILG
jgi:flavorubredoxin